MPSSHAVLSCTMTPVEPSRERHLMPVALWLAVGSGALTAAALPPGGVDNQPEVIGITTPNQEAVLAAIGPGRIARIEVLEGALVHEGELVFAQDEEAQRIRTELAKASAETTLEIELAGARRDLAQRNLKRLSGLFGADSASSKEYSDAVADADITRLEFELAKFKQKQAVKAYEWETQRLRDFRAYAPFTGFVAEHIRHVGETVDENEGVVRLVQLDPLKVSIDCPLTLARTIKRGDRFIVRPLDPRWGPRVATVVTAGRVIDAASQTFKVKLQVDNADAGWMAGLKVAVAFSAEASTDTAAPRTMRPASDPDRNASAERSEEPKIGRP